MNKKCSVNFVILDDNTIRVNYSSRDEDKTKCKWITVPIIGKSVVNVYAFLFPEKYNTIRSDRLIVNEAYSKTFNIDSIYLNMYFWYMSSYDPSFLLKSVCKDCNKGI